MLKLCLVLALVCAGASAATELVILGTGTPRTDPDRSGPAVAVVDNNRACLFDDGPATDPLMAERIHAALISGVEQVEMELRRKVEKTTGNGSVRSPSG
jgi:hypothetical protein